MISVNLGLLTDSLSIYSAVKWCNECCADKYIFFGAESEIGEPASIWFFDDSDAIAFMLRFRYSQHRVLDDL